jgi:hypothetical protein
MVKPYLGLALLSEQWGRVSGLGQRWLAFTSWLPVPLLALTLLLIAASQVQAIAAITAHIQPGRCGCEVNNPQGVAV